MPRGEQMDVDRIIQFVKEYKYSKYAYPLTILMGMAFIVYITAQTDFCSEDFNVWSYVLWCLLIVITVVVICGIFAKERQFPKFKEDETGIMFVIKTNSKETRQLVEQHFISAVERAFRENCKHKNKIYLLEPYHANLFMEVDEDGRMDILQKSNAKLAFVGECTSGNKDGKRGCYIDLEDCVLQSELRGNSGYYLDNDMKKVMVPFKELYISEDNNLDEFRSASKALQLVSEFIIASTLFYMQQYEDSVELFEELQTELKKCTKKLPSIDALKFFVPIRCWQNYMLLSGDAYDKYREEKDESELDTMYSYLQKSRQFYPNNAFYYTSMTLYHFCKNRDVVKARECVQMCKGSKYVGLEYRFNDVFLTLYEKYTPYTAIKCYKKYSGIFGSKPSFELCNEIEEFIYDIIEKEPDKGYMQWLLVLLTNYRGDYILSKEALQKFENVPKLELNDDMRRYIEKIKRYNENEICFLLGEHIKM